MLEKFRANVLKRFDCTVSLEYIRTGNEFCFHFRGLQFCKLAFPLNIVIYLFYLLAEFK